MFYQEKNYSYNQNANKFQPNQFQSNPFQLKMVGNTSQRISVINQPLMKNDNEINIRRSTLMSNPTNKYSNQSQFRNSFVSQQPNYVNRSIQSTQIMGNSYGNTYRQHNSPNNNIYITTETLKNYTHIKIKSTPIQIKNVDQAPYHRFSQQISHLNRVSYNTPYQQTLNQRDITPLVNSVSKKMPIIYQPINQNFAELMPNQLVHQRFHMNLRTEQEYFNNFSMQTPKKQNFKQISKKSNMQQQQNLIQIQTQAKKRPSKKPRLSKNVYTNNKN